MIDNETKIKIAGIKQITAGRSFWAADAAALLTVWTVWTHIPNAHALFAGGALFVANRVLSVIYYFYNRDRARESRPDYWENWLIAGNVAAGVAWGLISAFLLYTLPHDIALEVAMITILVLTAWSVTNIPSMKCIAAFFLSTVTPPLLTTLQIWPIREYPFIFIALSFLVFIIRHAQQVTLGFHKSVEQLSGLEKVAIAEAQRSELISHDYARMRHLMDATPVPVAVVDLASGLIVYLNQGGLDLLGIKDLPEKPDVYAADFFAFAEEYDRAVASSIDHNIIPVEFQAKRADGSLFWAYYTASQLVYEGKPAIIGTIMDVTARRQAEEELRQSAEKYRQATEQNNARLRDVLDSVPVPIVVSKKKDGVLLYMNRIALDFAGIKDLSEIPGFRGVDFFSDATERDSIQSRRATGSYIEEKDYKNLEFQLKRSDGASVWVFYSAEQMVYEGHPAIIGTFTDITKRRQAEEDLRQSEEKFRLLADHANDVISIFSMEGVCLYVSPSIERILGYKQEEVVGQSLVKFMAPNDLEEIYLINAKDIKNMEAGVTPGLNLYRIRHKAGNWEWIEGSISVKRDSVTGKPTQLSSVSRLVTERVRHEQELKEARKRAEAADRAKSDFLAHMSHEIRTPLNAVIGFSEVMRDELFGPLGSPRYLEYINDIHNSGTHLLALINDVLDISKVEAGKFDLQEDRVGLDTIIDAAFRFMCERAENKRIALHSRLHVKPDIWCDQRILVQVMLNMIGNAIKFTPERGNVTVESLMDDSGNLVLTVTDTGIGIAEEDIPTVMKPFGQARANSSLAAAEPGTGLGLPLSRSFIEKHGGTLVITSEVGIGTRVSITIPASRVMQPDQDGRDIVSAAL